MIWKADPDKVLRFIEENFDLFRRLYRAQLDDNVVAGQEFDQMVRGSGDVTVKRLFEYKLLIPQYNDYRLSEPLRQFLGFLLSEFKPLLPEELEKYRVSLEELLDRIAGVAHGLHFLTRAIFGRVGHGMATIAIGLHFQQNGTVAALHPFERFLGRAAHSEHVHAVDLNAGNTEAFAATIELIL